MGRKDTPHSGQGDDRLITAIRQGKAKAVGKLIRGGADPNTCAADGTPALMVATELSGLETDIRRTWAERFAGAVTTGKRIPSGKLKSWQGKIDEQAGLKLTMTNMLLHSGVDPNGTNANGETALTQAVTHRGSSATQALFKTAFPPVTHAKPNASKFTAAMAGPSPLGRAARQACMTNASITKILLDNGADPDQMRDGMPILDDAVRLNDIQLVDILLHAGAQPDNPGNKGIAPLHTAASLGHADIVDHLISANAKVDIKDDRGNTPLIQAARLGREKALSRLIAASASVNHQNVDGSSALIFAAANDHLGAVRMLATSNANIALKTSDGMTAMDAAKHKGCDKVVDMLQEFAPTKPAPSEPAPVAPATKVKIECTNCGKRLRVEPHHAGKKARCPKCKAVITIPEIQTA
jgi:uncharacterized protein